jgi:hypothetical protein
LLTINWADSAPGFSWPCAYYLTPVRAHKAVVITSSDDSPETFGWCDIAVGRFSLDRDPLVGAKRTLIKHWKFLAGEGQGRWAEFLEQGLVDEATAAQWAQAVWPPGEAEEE